MDEAKKKRTPRKLPKKSKGFLWNFSKRLEKASNSLKSFPEKMWKWVRKTISENVRFFRENIKESAEWLGDIKSSLIWEILDWRQNFPEKVAKWNEFFETRLLPVAIVLCAGFLSCIILIPNFWESLEKAWEKAWQLCVHYTLLFAHYKYMHYAVVWVLFLFPLLFWVIQHWLSKKKETSNLYSNLPTEGSERIIASFLEESPVIDRTADVYGFIQKINLLDLNKRNVVALDGKWGCGKSTFVSHVILLRTFMFMAADRDKKKIKWGDVKTERLRELRERCRKICVQQASGKLELSLTDEYLYYDAWKNDAIGEDPIFSIIHDILPDQRYEGVMESLWGLFDKISINLGLKIISIRLSLRDLFAVRKTHSELDGVSKNDGIRRKINALIDRSLARRQRYYLVKEMGKNRLELKSVVKKRFVIFIDELDRCNPLFAVKVLERVKHFFDNPNLVFVFSVNLEQLQHTIRKVYGHDFDAIHYLHRFFTERAELPAVDTQLFIRNEYLGAKQKQEKTEEQNNG